MDLASAGDFLDRETSRGWYYSTLSIRIKESKYLAEASLDIQEIADSEGLDYVNKLEATNAIQSYTDVTGIQVAAITLIVAFLVIFNSIQMSVHERIKELGTIRALGAETTSAIGITVFEGFASDEVVDHGSDEIPFVPLVQCGEGSHFLAAGPDGQQFLFFPPRVVHLLPALRRPSPSRAAPEEARDRSTLLLRKAFTGSRSHFSVLTARFDLVRARTVGYVDFSVGQ